MEHDIATTEWFYGLASNNGIESISCDYGNCYGFDAFPTLDEVKAEKFAMCIKAAANTEENSVVFSCLFNSDDGSKLLEFFKSRKHSELLECIKTKSLKIQLATYGTSIEEANRRWDTILKGFNNTKLSL